MSIVAFFFALILWPLWGGFTLSVLWGWFLVPKFGFPVINWAMAAGISLIITMAKGVSVNTNSSKDDSNWVIIGTIIIPLIALAIGWVLKQYAV